MSDPRINMIISARDDASKVLGGVSSGLGEVKSAIAGLAAGIAAGLSFGALAAQFVRVNKEFQGLRASLETVTGSAANATIAFEALQQFAASTPYALSEVTAAFIKMQARGLQPTEASLQSFGNTASAMNKSLDQMIEAVADATTGEFERLKEFGISAQSQGDKITFTFQGVSTTVKKSAGEISRYLEDLGNNNFAGAMQRQMGTLQGAISNLGDAFDSLLYRAGETSGANDQLASAIGNLSALISQPSTLTALSNFAAGVATIIEYIADLALKMEGSISTTTRWIAAWSVGDISTAEFLKTLGKEVVGFDRGTGFRRLQQLELERDWKSGQLAMDTATMPPNPRALAGLTKTQPGAGGAGSPDAAAKKLADKWNKTFSALELENFAAAAAPLEAELEKIRAKYTQLRAEFGNKPALNVFEEQELAAARLNQELRQLATAHRELETATTAATDSWSAFAQQFEGDTTWDNLREKYAGIDDGLQNLKETGEGVFADLKTAVTGWAAQMSSSLNEAFWAADASFSKILESFAKMITQMMIQKSVVEPLMSGLFGKGGDDGWLGALGKIAGTAVQGWLGSGTTPAATPSSVPTGSFNLGARELSAGWEYQHQGGPVLPRFHAGGLLADEVPTILQTGERVLSRQQNRVFDRLAAALDGGGSGGGTTVTVVNNSGVQAQTRETQDNRGNRRVEVVIGEMVAGEVKRAGGTVNTAMRGAFGMQPALVSR